MTTIVSETGVARYPRRVLVRPVEAARNRPRAAILSVLGLATLVYLSGLGRSSLFIDEVFSWNASNHGLDGVNTAVQQA
jgi:hypothetical protein